MSHRNSWGSPAPALARFNAAVDAVQQAVGDLDEGRAGSSIGAAKRLYSQLEGLIGEAGHPPPPDPFAAEHGEWWDRTLRAYARWDWWKWWREWQRWAERVRARLTPAKRTGRPRKGESDKERLVIAALALHHRCHGRSVGKHTPATTKDLANLASGTHVTVSDATVSRFFKKKFPGRGYKGNEAACVRDEIGMLIAKWQGDVSAYLPDLLPQESGCKDDD
jgi:hypothetical protein